MPSSMAAALGEPPGVAGSPFVLGHALDERGVVAHGGQQRLQLAGAQVRHQLGLREGRGDPHHRQLWQARPHLLDPRARADVTTADQQRHVERCQAATSFGHRVRHRAAGSNGERVTHQLHQRGLDPAGEAQVEEVVSVGAG